MGGEPIDLEVRNLVAILSQGETDIGTPVPCVRGTRLVREIRLMHGDDFRSVEAKSPRQPVDDGRKAAFLTDYEALTRDARVISQALEISHFGNGLLS